MRKRKNAEFRKPEILESLYNIIIKEGIEGASMAKIAKKINIHTSLIFHYFQNKENMLIELAKFIEEKYDPPYVRKKLKKIKDPKQRFEEFLNSLFSEEDLKSVDHSVYYAFYYLTYRNEKIRECYTHMFKKHRDFIVRELDLYMREGVIKKIDLEIAADFIVSLFEGLGFIYDFLADDKPHEVYGKFAKDVIKQYLTT
ncbi:MAG: TetR/AcrR family transcriptional regulator [Deltaproteobacteria bacterium]|nr:TetR/AcrR family transcriptional regulator [Deltaproteobacteria bacterium]